MPKIRVSNIPQDALLQKNFAVLTQFLNGGIGLDNLLARTIQGTTASTANTSKLFPHGLLVPPTGGLILLGNVYVFDANAKFLDIRSTGTNTRFILLAI